MKDHMDSVLFKSEIDEASWEIHSVTCLHIMSWIQIFCIDSVVSQDSKDYSSRCAPKATIDRLVTEPGNTMFLGASNLSRHSKFRPIGPWI